MIHGYEGNHQTKSKKNNAAAGGRVDHLAVAKMLIAYHMPLPAVWTKRLVAISFGHIAKW